jgi:hypothetical protein
MKNVCYLHHNGYFYFGRAFILGAPTHRDNEKNYKKNLYLLDLKIWGLKRCSFDLVYFKY